MKAQNAYWTLRTENDTAGGEDGTERGVGGWSKKKAFNFKLREPEAHSLTVTWDNFAPTSTRATAHFVYQTTLILRGMVRAAGRIWIQGRCYFTTTFNLRILTPPHEIHPALSLQDETLRVPFQVTTLIDESVLLKLFLRLKNDY